MDIYTRKSRLKLYLAVAGGIIVAISMFYTNYLTGKLADEERKKVELYLQAMEDLSDTDDEDAQFCDFTLHFQILQSNTTIPVMVVNDRGGVDDHINFNGDTSALALQQEVERMKEEGFEPIQGFAYSIYYKESTLLKQLRYFPLVQLILIAAFVGFGYMGFNSARRAEQNRVWVGMAKETAHQLGTPISAIIAWIEHLKAIREGDEETQEVLGELRNDVSRLELIADRFSKIGSAPKLEPIDVYEELDKCRAYMQRRASRKIVFEFPAPGAHKPKAVQINPHLFDWVVENLLRNALDAMESTGKISAEVYDDADYIYIDISDSGKGIPSGKFKTVFQPGYTTKKRGWGFPALAKRIIEQYHSGKIFVKRSEEGKGTTFTIQMPKS